MWRIVMLHVDLPEHCLQRYLLHKQSASAGAVLWQIRGFIRYKSSFSRSAMHSRAWRKVLDLHYRRNPSLQLAETSEAFVDCSRMNAARLIFSKFVHLLGGFAPK